MADKRTYSLATEMVAVDENAFIPVDKVGFAEAQKLKVNELTQDLSYNSGTKTISITNGTGCVIDNAELATAQISGLLASYSAANQISITAGACKDDTNIVDIEVIQMVKNLTPWSVGTGGGLLASGVLTENRAYYLYAMYDSTTDETDYIAEQISVGLVLPGTYSHKKIIGAFFSYTNIASLFPFGVSNWITYYSNKNIYSTGCFRNPLPINFVSEYTLLLLAGNLSVSNLICTAGGFDNIDYQGSTFTKDATALFVAGDGNGCLSNALVASTNYYLYAILNSSTGERDLLIAPNSISFPAGYNYHTLIGYGATDAASTLRIWRKSDSWDDYNFDMWSIVKAASLEADAPIYEDLFTSGVKVSTYNGTTDMFTSIGCEYPHCGKVGADIQFHFHWAPENANAGNAVFFVDTMITNSGDVIGTTTRKTITLAMPGIAKKVAMANFTFTTGTTLKPGSQIAFKFGRLASSDAADTYASKIAVRTFGFHYLKDSDGSRFISDK
jgi:hypothetical protein